jgi:hypothetical protein
VYLQRELSEMKALFGCDFATFEKIKKFFENFSSDFATF